MARTNGNIGENRIAIANRIGRQIKELRQQRSLSGKALAKKAKITPAYVTRLEQGVSVPTITVLNRVAEALGEDLSYFAKESEVDKKLFRYLNQTNLGNASIDEILKLSPEAKKDLLMTIEYLMKINDNDP